MERSLNSFPLSGGEVATDAVIQLINNLSYKEEQSAVIIQSLWRCTSSRLHFAQYKNQVIIAQSAARSFLVRRNICALAQYALTIQCAFRQYMASSNVSLRVAKHKEVNERMVSRPKIGFHRNATFVFIEC
jgi:hypothetical protein